METSPPALSPPSAAPPATREAERLRDLSPQQWKSGLAAWLGWMFDGLDMHLGVMLASLALFLLSAYPPRTVFLVGVLPALLVLWIRRAVPEPEEWHTAKQKAAHAEPGVLELFRGNIRRTTVLTLLVCAFALTAHWAFLFWYVQHLRNLPDLAGWTDDARSQLVSKVVWLVIGASIAGNFLAAWLARRM